MSFAASDVAQKARPDAAAVLALLKPVTRFPPMRAYLCGLKFSGVGMKQPDPVVYESVRLKLSIIVPLLFLWQYSSKAALMLVPDLIWVAIATKLTAGIMKLNLRLRDA